MAGYSLQQLLAWCHDDHLIDTYSIHGEKVVVQFGGSTKELDTRHAIDYLKALIRKRSTHAGMSAVRR